MNKLKCILVIKDIFLYIILIIILMLKFPFQKHE